MELIKDFFVPTIGASKMSITQLLTRPAITCLKLAIETQVQGVKYVQSRQ